jgi:hypothetical protein
VVTEIHHDNRTYLGSAVLIFALVAAITIAITWCAARFLKHPSKSSGSVLAKACFVCVWMLLPSIGLGISTGLALILAAIYYMALLRPAVLNQPEAPMILQNR